MRLESLDHLVLTVADIEESCAFYCDALGMEREVFAGGRNALRFGAQKINLHPASGPFPPHARHPTSGSADLCFLTKTPIEEVAAHLGENGIDVVEGPVERTGARRPLMSIYCFDPDGNLIEISNSL